MTDRPPIDLDSRRDAAGMMGADMGRGVAAPATQAREAKVRDLADMDGRLATPLESDLSDAAERALHSLRTCAKSIEARDARRAALFARSIADLSRQGEAASAPLTERPAS
jgi:hypothetical protein